MSECLRLWTGRCFFLDGFTTDASPSPKLKSDPVWRGTRLILNELRAHKSKICKLAYLLVFRVTKKIVLVITGWVRKEWRGQQRWHSAVFFFGTGKDHLRNSVRGFNSVCEIIFHGFYSHQLCSPEGNISGINQPMNWGVVCLKCHQHAR